ncbi:MAG: hypothetical protein R3E09_02420 [Novosphingobium sp.]|nr:hypothetical protein [Novosphingobium sp.]MCB2077518.1 hypothetical protein [Novosphingobium sp.]
MSENEAPQGKRALAQIESDLQKAEEAFVDADNRLKEAERDRHTALDTINKHQMEFDEAVTELRQRSIPESKWRLQPGETKAPLVLQSENIAENVNVSGRPNLTSVTADKSVAAEFKRLRVCAQINGGDVSQM